MRSIYIVAQDRRLSHRLRKELIKNLRSRVILRRFRNSWIVTFLTFGLSARKTLVSSLRVNGKFRQTLENRRSKGTSEEKTLGNNFFLLSLLPSSERCIGRRYITHETAVSGKDNFSSDPFK